jgi:tRNA(adenine34) deaminase
MIGNVHSHRLRVVEGGRVTAVSALYRERMRETLANAALAAEHGDVPVAATVLNESGEPIAAARNERELRQDPTAHAEILALREAAAVTGNWHLTGTTLVVTLEPCAMCAGAIIAARVAVVVFGAWDPKAGAAGSVYDLLRDRRLNHTVEVVSGVEEEACGALLNQFFAARR